MNKNKWIPEIMYEENDNGMTSHIPFIMVPKNEIMPNIIFIFENRETGEYEPDERGNPVPIMEMDLHQYADMNKLKLGLDEETYDKVRICLGLEKIKDASDKGKKISENIKNNLEK